MALFSATYFSKLDKKGRVSVPSPFRAALLPPADDKTPLSLVLSPHHKLATIECYPQSWLERITASLDHYALLSDEQDDLALTLIADAMPLTLDPEGRILPPAGLLAGIGITDTVAFVGLGPKFQMWSPDALTARKAEARANVLARGLTLPLKQNGGGA